MTNEKAREYFSAYAEGTLDAGLARAFETKLKADSGLQTEFEQFEATLKELEGLRFEMVEVPFDLNERISAAIDKSIFDKKQARQPGFGNWIRNLAFAGVAAAAIIGAYMTIVMPGKSAGPNVSGPFAPATTVEQIVYSISDGGVKMNFKPSTTHKVTVKGGSDGQSVFTVDSAGWINELRNDQAGSAVFTVDVAGEIPPTLVIVPGSRRSNETNGQGTIVEFAKAIANRYGSPVILQSTATDHELTWELKGTDGLQAMTDVLKDTYMVDSKAGILTVSDH